MSAVTSNAVIFFIVSPKAHFKGAFSGFAALYRPACRTRKP
jgi:hypothetical protein